MKNCAYIIILLCAIAAFCAEPDIHISFNRGLQADFGGTGNTGTVLEGFREPIGMKGAIVPATGLKEAEFLVPALEGKGLRIGKLEKERIYKLRYAPLPALSRLAGTVSLWVRPDDWEGTDNEFHVFFAADGKGQRIFLYKTPDQNIKAYYGNLANEIPPTIASFPARNWKKGQWHHLCLAYDEKTLELHVDGVCRALVPMAKLLPADFPAIIFGEHWKGNPGISTIDEVRIFNGVRLTAAEMQAEYTRLAQTGVSGAPLEFCAAPRTAKVDGEIKAGEYSLSGNGFRSIRKNYYSSLQSTWHLAYDQEKLYFGMVSDKAEITTQAGRDSTPYSDDSVELYLSDIYGVPGMYKLIFNSGTGFYDAKDGNVNWNSQGVEFKSREIGGKWHFEAAIPWSNFGIAPEEGKCLRLNICRTFARVGELTQISPTVNASYGDKSYFAQLKYVKEAPQLDMTGFGKLNVGKLDCALHVKSAKDDDITWKMEAMDSYKPFIYSKDFKLGQGGEFTEKCVRELPLDRTLEISVVSKKLGLLYHNSIDYHNSIALTHSYIYTDIPKDQMVFVYKNNSLNSGRHRLHAAFVKKDGSTEYEQTVEIPDDSSVTYGRIDVSKLTPGTAYDVKFQVTAPDGKEIINSQEEYGYYKNGAPWKDTKYGLEDEDKALPPWTPVQAKDGVFQCWGRKCEFGGNGLIGSFKSQGKELLTGPSVLRVDGRSIGFKARLLSCCDARALYRLEALDKTVPITVNVRAEFDGMMYFEVELGNAEYKSIKLEIPMDRAYADAFDDCSSIFEKISFRDNPKPHYDSNFVQKPFWWCGGDEIGLMGGTQSKRGWYIKDKAKSMAIDLSGKTALLTMNMVDTPLKVTAPRKLTFYLDATPVKPKRMDTARARERHNIMHEGISGKYFYYLQPEYLTSWARWVQNRVKHDKRIDVDKMQYFANVKPKGASPLSPAWHYYATMWVNPPPPLGNYCMNSGVFRNPSSWTWSCLNDKSHFDFQVSCIQTILTPHQHNFCNAGFYFDLGWPRACGNANHGCAWKDEFGDVLLDNDIYALRDYYIRAYRMLKKARPDAYFYGHTYLSRTPTDSFFDLCVAGEMYDRYLSKNGNYYDVLTPELMRIAYASRTVEQSFSLIPQFLRGLQCYNPEKISTYNPLKPEWDRPFRHFLAYLHLHGMYSVHEFWTAGEELPPKGEGHVDKLFAALDRLGWENVRFHGYYTKDRPVKCLPEHPRVMASAYTNGGRLFLVALNDTDQTRDIQVRLDGKVLAQFSNMNGKDIYNGKQCRIENGSLKVTLEGRDSMFALFE